MERIPKTKNDAFEAYLKATNEKQLIADFFDTHFQDLAIAQSKDRQRVLDMGCGSGEISLRFLETLRKNGVNYSYDALDISEGRLDTFRQKVQQADLADIRFLNQSFESFDHSPDSYDFLIACQSLYYFEKLKPILETLLHISKESMIVHHGSTGLEAFEERFKDYIKKSQFGVSTFADVQAALDEMGDRKRYQINFENLACDVNIEKCKDPSSLEGRALMSFFLGNDIDQLPQEIQSEMMNFMDKNYPNTIQRQQGIFFVSKD
jgi:SAM-dependent methyltransferase